jgi:penicillin amidase
MRSRWKLVLLTTVGIVVLLAGGALLWVRSSLPERGGTVELPGLRAPVTVEWTPRAVPAIRAESMEDAVFAQGFLHARDRLWQMEVIRRAVEGRLAEVLGDGALPTDRFMRRLGLWTAAREAEPLLNDRERRIIEAYAAGVNAALEHRKGALPPEFLVLRHRPEPWRPVHTLAVAKMMSFTLAAYGESVSVARALRRLEPERVRWLFPDYPDWGRTILIPPEPPPTPPLARALVDGLSIAAASNSWVVAGSRTASGKPILANDMHLELQAPALWYLVSLSAAAGADGRALDVVGVSIPGAPLVITGRNRAVAWGLTNAYVDDVDLFMERVDPADRGRYLVPGGSEPFQVAAETLWVKGRDEPEILEVRRTRHGPVLPVEGDVTGDTVLALAWTTHGPSTVFRGVLGINLARSWDEFVQAVDYMDDPHQNLVYADTAGHIGYIMGGTVPIRGERRPAPVAPRPGWTGEWDWTGELPFEEHPRVLNPPAGFVVTANNRQTVEPVSELISQTWLQPFRAMRIAQMIDEHSGPVDPAATLAMQMDVYDLFAERFVDRAVDAAAGAGLASVADRLRAWDRRAAADSRTATVFYTWSEEIRRGLARDLYGGDPEYFSRESLAAVLDRRAVPWAEAPEAAYRAMAEEAMRQAVDRSGDRPWGQANRAVHGHVLGDVDLLDRLLGLNVGPSPHYGSPTTVNVAHWAFSRPAENFPFLTTAGPSMRQVIDMGNLAAAGGFVIPTGQSGIPFSRHYDDQHHLWRDGGLLELPLDRPADGAAAERMTLVPEARDDG